MKVLSRKLNKKTIELINSIGPFNHSHWDSRGIKISNEDNLVGRADFLAKKIREIIKKKFSLSEIKKMTIADIGCYDGWILHQLSDLPFKKMAGIEPRIKNILKGKKIREILNIKTRVAFKEGDLDSLGSECFDIVLCLGLLHHIESIPIALRQLDTISKKLLIIDTICIPSEYINEDFKKDIEMKDVIYQKKKLCGLTGQKYESFYYDGSTAKTGIVSVPSVESLIMYLDILGYNPIKVIAGPKEFKKAMKKNKRSFQEVLLYGLKRANKDYDLIGEYIKDYEGGLIENDLDSKPIEDLYSGYCLKQKLSKPRKEYKLLVKYIKSQRGHIPKLIKDKFRDKHRFEIIKNLRFNPIDKISFEYGKILYHQKKYKEAIDVLQNITQKLNADWRSVYRSFYILSLLYSKLGDRKKSNYYKKLCLSANPAFPLFN